MDYSPFPCRPPENPFAVFCEACGEQIMPDDMEDAFSCVGGGMVHNDTDCLKEYAEFLGWKITNLESKIEKMIERYMS